ncbi:penicillin-binding protein 2 [bacterium SCSIO 12741]|nr:penicillin-binding protein 2 [bacterium SCSIO 12741]
MNPFEDRKFVILGIFFTVVLIFIGRLFYIQIVDDSYALSARNQAVRYVTQYPVRGLIYDRHGELLVYNEAAYDLMVIPRRVKDLDTLGFCELVGITDSTFVAKMEKAKDYSTYKASILLKQIPAGHWAKISERLYKYKGFFGQKRTLRKYPAAAAGHTLGYISEVNYNDLEKDPYYLKGDYIGKRGLEREYEAELRGKRGKKVLMVDVHNRVKGSYMNGKYDTLPVSGFNLISTLDRELQVYGEKLMQGKRGSIVAIEPSSGEILAMVSAPGYDPNLLVGRPRSENYNRLQANDSLNPLFNRAISAEYRPGSIFKLVQSLIALESGVIRPETRFVCNRSIIGCHGAHTNDDLMNAIKHSCNPYFYQVYKRMIQPGEKSNLIDDAHIGLARWQKKVRKFGFGVRLQTDLPGVHRGSVPGVTLYDKWYRGSWNFRTIYSNSIGEGELQVIPIQMANLASIIANKGYYYTPHFIRSIGENDSIREAYRVRHNTDVSEEHFEPVIEAMYQVVNESGGTARRARMDSVVVCGKTGTVQNDPWPDHSVFIAFAPRENPKIAIAVYVEYSDFGGTWSAPIASLMIEKYLYGEVTRLEKEKRILDAEFLDIYEGKKKSD